MAGWLAGSGWLADWRAGWLSEELREDGGGVGGARCEALQSKKNVFFRDCQKFVKSLSKFTFDKLLTVSKVCFFIVFLHVF